MRYGDAHVNFYHGFTQPGRLDRQELRLVFEQGDVLLTGWVPTYARVHAIADESMMRAIAELFAGARIDVLAAYGPKDRHASVTGANTTSTKSLSYIGAKAAKSRVYCELLRAFMSDQAAWIRDPTHVRKTTEQNGRDSVAMACAADRMAHQSSG